MNTRNEGSEGFVMIYPKEISTSVIDALRDKLLQPRDLAVLMALMTEVDRSNGKVEITQRFLASRMGVKECDCSASFRRLRSQGLVTLMRDSRTGYTHYLINPRLLTVGGPQ